jgi:predicted transcriptional regulator YdeE
MLKVGDFSKLANVTVKTLRHYDQLGLLKPVWIDRYSGYRYYRLEQLPRLNRILALKDMGFSLAQIRGMLSQDLSPAALRSLFDQKQQELARRLQDEQERLQRVAERLQQIEREGRLPDVEVTLKAVPPQPVAAKRFAVSSLDELERRFSQVRAEVQGWVAARGLRGRSQWLILYHQNERRLERLDVEVAQVLEEPRSLPEPASPAVKVYTLPEARRMACVLLPENRAALRSAYAALYPWTEQNRYHIGQPIRQVLLQDPAGAAVFSEVQAPVESSLELKENLLAKLNRKDDEMEPKFVDLPAFDIVGVRYYGRNENQEIAVMWGDFNQRCGAIRHVAADSPAYGICITDPNANHGEFEYVASFRVDQVADVPEGMVTRHVLAHKYAVFTHVGALDKLGDTYRYIYQVWLPQSGFEIAELLDFELYDEDFKDFASDSRLYIYVPVKPK